MPLPTFVIAGAQKCGTSSLSAMLRQHPEIFMAKPKELHFFDRHFDRGVEWYVEQFTAASDRPHLGEATPAYLYDERARGRMLDTLPTARIAVILRDPVSRAYSHYWHSHRLGHETETFERALALEPERLQRGNRAARSRFSYTDRGHYIDQLEALEARHDRGLLHVMLLEDLIADRLSVLGGLLAFIGADPAGSTAIEARWTNRYRVKDAGSDRAVPTAYPPMDPDTRAELRTVFADSTRRLEDWLDRDLSMWTKP